MDSLAGGYTNATRRLRAGQIEKVYRGDDRWERAALERACLAPLAERLAVPVVIALDEHRPSMTMVDVGGRHGQELIDAGHASLVLRRAGELLRDLQRIDPAAIPELGGSGDVIVHGDFGPQNLIIDITDEGHVATLVDWEFAHRGDPVEDLAWAEWIVRMHHPHAVEAVRDLHQSAGLSVGWPARQAAMVRRSEDLLRYCEHHRPRDVELWRTRLAQSEAWTE